MFLDASAIIAILGDEEDAASMTARLEARQGNLYVSPVAVYESVLGLARKKSGKGANDAPVPQDLIDQADMIVRGFLREVGAREVSVTAQMANLAVSACKKFGRAVGHPAKLNLGDCFAYACARSLDVPLLYKGNDFPLTDID